MPLPESMVANEVEMRGHSLDEQLERAGATRDAYLEASGLTAEQLAADMDAAAKRSVKAGFVLDQVAVQEELGVEQAELNNFVIEQAYRMGVQPDRLAKELADRGQIASAVAEVLRAKALGLIAERAAVTDEAGRVVDLKALAREQAKQDEDEAEDAVEAAAEAEPGRRRGRRGRRGGGRGAARLRPRRGRPRLRRPPRLAWPTALTPPPTSSPADRAGLPAQREQPSGNIPAQRACRACMACADSEQAAGVDDPALAGRYGR